MLEHYYDLGRKDHFDQRFGGLWAHEHPTEEQSRYLVLGRAFLPLSEKEFAQGYGDLFLGASRDVAGARYSWLLELKYLKTGAKAGQIEAAFEEAEAQVRRYASDRALLPLLLGERELKAGMLVFVGAKKVLYRAWEEGGRRRRYRRRRRRSGDADGVVDEVWVPLARARDRRGRASARVEELEVGEHEAGGVALGLATDPPRSRSPASASANAGLTSASTRAPLRRRSSTETSRY